VSVGGTAVGTIQAGATGGSGEGLTITLSAGATPATVASLIGAVGYDNAAGDTPTAGDRTVRVTIDDGTTAGAGAPADVTVQVTAVNDDPTATGVPTTITASEDVASNVDLTGLSLADVDAGGSEIVLTLGVDAGTLTATSGGGVTVGGAGTGSLTLTGSVANLNAFLGSASAVQYTSAPDANGTGAATLTLTANDQGNSGTGGGTDIALGTASIDITPVNDAPTAATAPADQTATPGDAFSYTLPAGSFTDPDAGDTLTLSASLAGGGALPAWLSFDAASRTFSGTPADGDAGTLSIAVTATDTSNASETATFDLTVEPGEDPVTPSVTTLDRGPVRVTVIDTGEETVLVANSGVVSGRALEAILGTFDRGNSPLAQAFRAAAAAASDAPSQTLQDAAGDATTRGVIYDIEAVGGETLIYQDGEWRPLDLETVLQLAAAVEPAGGGLGNAGPGDQVRGPAGGEAAPLQRAAATPEADGDAEAPAGTEDPARTQSPAGTEAALAAARANAKAHWLDAAVAALAEAEPLDGTAALAGPLPAAASGEAGGFGGQLRERAGAFDRDADALATRLLAAAG
jgi:hypothetical protein